MRGAGARLVFSAKQVTTREDLAQHSGKPIGRTSTFSVRFRARVVWTTRPSREQRAQGRPGAHRTHGPRATKKARGRTTGTGGSSGLPCAMVLTVSFALSPVTGLFCHRRLADNPRISTRLGSARIERDLAPATGRQDHTTSPSAKKRCSSLRGQRSLTEKSALRSLFVRNALASTASRTNARDDRDTPLLPGLDNAEIAIDLGGKGSGIF